MMPWQVLVTSVSQAFETMSNCQLDITLFSKAFEAMSNCQLDITHISQVFQAMCVEMYHFMLPVGQPAASLVTSDVCSFFQE